MELNTKTEIFNSIETVNLLFHKYILEIFTETYNDYDYLVEDCHNYSYLDTYLEY